MSLHVVVSGWLLGQPSGANRRLLALLEHAGRRRAADERITVLHRIGLVPPSIAGIEWQPIAIPGAPTWRRVLAERLLLSRRLRELGATVYDHGFLPLPRLLIPTCLVVHDLRAVDGLTRWPRWFATAVLRQSCLRANAIVAPSRWTAARIQALAPHAAEPVVLPNGVELTTTATPPPTDLPPCGYLLHVGHLEARKNLAVVVRALALLPTDERPELWLAGRDAGALGSLQALAKQSGCAAQLRGLGLVGDDELHRLYAHCRAVVMPSLHEGFGIGALEALAHGRALLASNCAALPEVVGQHGTLLPPHEEAVWARAIGDSREPDAETAARRRDWAAQFAWATAAASMLTVWRRLHAR